MGCEFLANDYKMTNGGYPSASITKYAEQIRLNMLLNIPYPHSKRNNIPRIIR